MTSPVTPLDVEPTIVAAEKGYGRAALLKGRTVTRMPASGDADAQTTASSSGGGCYTIGCLLLIIGGAMYGVAQKNCNQAEQACDYKLKNAGEITMIVGGSMMAASCLCVALVCCCAGTAIVAANSKQ